ncbi:MAG: helix-turn-helix domain-containing protein, partial [Lachnospiraceae bacterium]|nr:helix-turn-helix domain-containing protein [Lachnospiraceae bacterium]
MEWMEAISRSVKYIEENITADVTAESVAKNICISPFYFQKGFSMLCGLTVSEYIRNRRMALAGSELANRNGKVIDIAMKYGYDSPDSFTKAFTRFHGITPSQAQKEGMMLKSFAPLKIKISLEGGYLMNYKIMKKEAFTVIASSKKFSYEAAMQDIPVFWQEHYAAGRGKYVDGTFGINID